jgi:non-ribosomal peptide synthetase component F
LLAGILESPSAGIYDLPLLSPADREQVLRTWNDTGAAPLAGGCLHQLFEAQAARTPEAEALVCGETRLTYRELDERAGRLARRLAALGVGPEVQVGVFVERSTEMVMALLAILKAGGAYVPIDPGYPADRLRSKAWDEFALPGSPHMDFIITVCDDAAGEACPVWPGHPAIAHWGVPDPAAVSGDDDARRAAYRTAFATLRRRVELLLALPADKLDGLAAASALQRIAEETR